MRSTGTPAATSWMAILDDAARAPSHHNLQPWRCQIRDARCAVFLDEARSGGLLDRAKQSALFSLGCFLETIEVAAAHHGFAVRHTTRDHNSTREPICVLDLRRGRRVPRTALAHRETNRRTGDRTPVPASAVRTLDRAVERPFRIVATNNDVAKKERVARALAEGASIPLRARAVHQEMMSMLRWTPAQAERHRDGIDTRTLSLPPASIAWLRKIRDFDGYLREVDDAAARTNGLPLLMWTPRIVFLVGPADRRPRTSVAAGRALQRAWLAATDAGLAVHPFAGLMLVLYEAPHIARATLGARPYERALALHDVLRDTLALKAGEQVWFAFRLFHAERCETPSLRRPASQFVEIL